MSSSGMPLTDFYSTLERNPTGLVRFMFQDARAYVDDYQPELDEETKGIILRGDPEEVRARIAAENETDAAQVFLFVP